MEKLNRIEQDTKRKICRDSIVGGVAGAAAGAVKGAGVAGVPGAVAGAIGYAAVGVLTGSTTGFINGTREQNKFLADNTNNPQRLERINTSNTVLDIGDIVLKSYTVISNIDNDKCLIM